MQNKIKSINTIFALVVMLLLIIATRGHNNWISSFVHLPDFTIPAMFIAGVYFRNFWVVFALILSTIAIDNYAIVHHGVSANCITPAYSVLPLTYYGIFWVSKYISALIINDDIVKNASIITLATCTQWLVATSSYYFFTATYDKTGWADFPTYVAKWSIVEIPTVLYWVVAIIISFTLIPQIIPALKIQKNA